MLLDTRPSAGRYDRRSPATCSKEGAGPPQVTSGSFPVRLLRLPLSRKGDRIPLSRSCPDPSTVLRIATRDRRWLVRTQVLDDGKSAQSELYAENTCSCQRVGYRG